MNDGDRLAKLRERSEYWERPGRVSYLLAALAATVTGKPAAVGQGHKLP